MGSVTWSVGRARWCRGLNLIHLVRLTGTAMVVWGVGGRAPDSSDTDRNGSGGLVYVCDGGVLGGRRVFLRMYVCLWLYVCYVCMCMLVYVCSLYVCI